MSVTLWCTECHGLNVLRDDMVAVRCHCGSWTFTLQPPALTGVMTARESDSPIPDPASVPPEEDS